MLRVPVDHYQDILTILQLEHFTPLFSFLDHRVRKELCVYITEHVIQSDTYIDSHDQVSALHYSAVPCLLNCFVTLMTMNLPPSNFWSFYVSGRPIPDDDRMLNIRPTRPTKGAGRSGRLRASAELSRWVRFLIRVGCHLQQIVDFSSYVSDENTAWNCSIFCRTVPQKVELFHFVSVFLDTAEL